MSHRANRPGDAARAAAAAPAVTTPTRINVDGFSGWPSAPASRRQASSKAAESSRPIQTLAPARSSDAVESQGGGGGERLGMAKPQA
jgi:hypothetical protein